MLRVGPRGSRGPTAARGSAQHAVAARISTYACQLMFGEHYIDASTAPSGHSRTSVVAPVSEPTRYRYNLYKAVQESPRRARGGLDVERARRVAEMRRRHRRRHRRGRGVHRVTDRHGDLRYDSVVRSGGGAILANLGR